MSNEPSFKFTNDPGSALLYYGDEFVAKVGSSHKKALMAVLVANEIMREEIDGFTKHVGAPTFQEAVSVLFRTKQQDEDKIEAMFAQVKEQAKELATLRECPGCKRTFIIESNGEAICWACTAESYRHNCNELLQTK